MNKNLLLIRICLIIIAFSNSKSIAIDDNKMISTQKMDTKAGYDENELKILTIYPELAQKAGIEGKVIISAFINEKGKLVDTKIEHSDNPIFIKSAENAVKQMKSFNAEIKDGKPISSWISIPIVFSLSQKNEVKKVENVEKEPDPDEFVSVEREVGVDIGELQQLIEYPLETRKAGLEGKVIIRALIDTHGVLVKLKIEYSDNAMQTVGKDFKAAHTPHTYIIWKENEKWIIKYSGAFDDNGAEPEKIKEHYLENAVNELLTGKQVSTPETKTFGCAISYRKK